MKILTTLLFYVSVSVFAQLNISINTDKESYEYGENIEIYCKITNLADTTFKFLAGSYQSCQAEFSFNDFNSWEHTACLALAEWLTFKPHASKIYKWIIDPAITGLPNKDGKQQIVGHYYFDLIDTIYINAPQVLGGKLEVSFLDSVSSKVQKIKDSLNIVVIKSSKIMNRYSETWELVDYRIDSLIMNFNKDSLFTYAQQNIFMNYESIIDENPVDYYPLAVGNKWYYEKIELENILDPINNFIITDSICIEVLADTAMDNGKKYFILSQDMIVSKFIRIDYNGIYFYFPEDSSEVFLYDYNTKQGDSYNIYNGNQGYVTRESDENVYIFGDSLETISFYYDSLVPIETTFGKNIGPIRYFTSHHEPITFKLFGCNIKGKIYGDTTLVSVSDNNYAKTPNEFILSQNYPNPFNPSTTIEYIIPNVNYNFSSSVLLKVYNILGQEVATLINKKQKAGNYKITFDAKNLPSGIYYYQLKTNGFVETKKMTLLK